MNDESPKPATSQSETTDTEDDVRNQYTIEELLGEGSFAQVWSGYKVRTKEKVAIKCCPKTEENHKRIQNEYSIWSMLSHPNVVYLLDKIEDDDRIFFVMEHVDGGDLCAFLEKKLMMEEEDARKLFIPLLSAVEHIHKLNIVHSDLKLENILLDSKRNPKLIDFNLSSKWQPGTVQTEFPGTIHYGAPELLLRKPYGPPSDIWSLGVLLFVMVCGRFPFDARNENNQVEVRKVFQQIISRQIEFPPHLSSNCINLIKYMLTVDQTKRPIVSEVRAHPWFQKEVVPKNVTFKLGASESATFAPGTEEQVSPPGTPVSDAIKDETSTSEGIARTLSINLSPLRMRTKNYELESPRRRNSIISPRKVPEKRGASSSPTPGSPRGRSFTSGLPSFFTEKTAPDSPRVSRGAELPSSPRNFQAITLKSPLATQQHGMNIRSHIKDFFSGFKPISMRLNGTNKARAARVDDTNESNGANDTEQSLEALSSPERSATSPKRVALDVSSGDKEKEKEKEGEGHDDKKKDEKKEKEEKKLKQSSSGFHLFMSSSPRERTSSSTLFATLTTPKDKDKDKDKEKDGGSRGGLLIFGIPSPKISRRHSSYSSGANTPRLSHHNSSHNFSGSGSNNINPNTISLSSGGSSDSKNRTRSKTTNTTQNS